MEEKRLNESADTPEALAFGIDIFVDMLVKLARGCPQHPAYRVKQAPLGVCEFCEELWDYKLSIDKTHLCQI